MEFLQLKYFQTAARLQHISKASVELNVTQPSLSIMISRLEDELGTQLFDRKGRNIRLNDAGQAFLARVNTIFRELESAKTEINEIAGKLSKHISIATTNPRLLSRILKNFLTNNVDVVIHQRYEMSDIIGKMLEAGAVDYCITAPPLEGRDIECEVLREEEIVLVVPKNHRLAERTSINLSEVANDPFITLVQNYNFRNITDSICRSAGFTPNIAFEVDDALMHEMVSLDRGIALLPMYIIRQFEDTNTDYRMLRIDEPKCFMKIGMSWYKNKYFSSAAINFKNFVSANYNKAFESIKGE